MRSRGQLPAVVFDVGDVWIDDGYVHEGRGNAGAFGSSMASFADQAMKAAAAQQAAAQASLKHPPPPAKAPNGQAWRGSDPAYVPNAHVPGSYYAEGHDVTGAAWMDLGDGNFVPWREPDKSGWQKFTSAVGSVAKTALPIAATVASVVPGVGTAVAFGLNTANQLAQGKSLQDAAISAAKNSLPGGPLAAAAFDAAVGIAKGQNVGSAALGAARSAAVAQGGPMAGAAFDAGIAAAQGKNVLDAAKKAAIDAAISQLPGGVAGSAAAELTRRVVNGENVATAALAVGGQAAQRAAEGAIRPMASVRQFVPGAPQALFEQAKTAISIAPQVTSLVQGPAGLVARTLLQNPRLQNVPAQQLAQHLGTTLPVVREAIGAIVGSAQKGSTGLAPAPHIAETVASNMTTTQALAEHSQVAPPASTPAPGSPSPYTAAPALGGKTVVPPKKMLASIFRHVPRAHRVPLFRMWKAHHKMPQNAGRVPVAGEQSMPLTRTTPVKWPVQAGQYPILISKRVTGAENRYKELFAANPDKKLNAAKDNFATFNAGEMINLPKSWNVYIIANPVNGEPMTSADVTGGVALPPWTPKTTTPPVVAAPPPIAIPGLPPLTLPPGLPPIPGMPPATPPPSTPPVGEYVMTLPPGMLTAIKGQLGVWGTREKKITPAGYPSTFDLMPPIGETADESFRSAVRSFQQWKGGGLRTDGSLDKATHDALNAYVLGVATSPPDAKTPLPLPPLPPVGGKDTVPPVSTPPAKTPPKTGTGSGGGGSKSKGKGGGAGVAIAAAAMLLPMVLGK